MPFTVSAVAAHVLEAVKSIHQALSIIMHGGIFPRRAGCRARAARLTTYFPKAKGGRSTQYRILLVEARTFILYCSVPFTVRLIMLSYRIFGSLSRLLLTINAHISTKQATQYYFFLLFLL